MNPSARELRSAAEVVLTVVRSDADKTPPRPVPAALRPYVGFTKLLPAPAVSAVCQVVDGDDDLRRRALDKATEEQVGKIGWLWLERPDGWAERIDELRTRASQTKTRSSRARDEKSDDRKAQRAERSAAAAKERADRAEAEAERLKRDLAAARQDTRSAEKAREASDADVARLQDERARAVRELKEVESDSAARLASVRALEDELADVRQRLAETEEAQAASVTELAAFRHEALSATPVDAVDVAPAAPTPEATAIDAAAVAETLSAAAATVAELSHHLAGLGRIFAPAERSSARPADAPRPIRTPKRRPQKLPIGMFDDGPEAVEYLARLDHVMVLVDGYNVSISGWPDMVLTEQRRRLVDALDALAARTGACPYVVFDGIDPDGGLHARSAPASVQVRFAPADIEADDILIGLMDDFPAAIPLVVVSSDRRVQDGCRAKGANIVGSAQLLEVLR